MNVQIWSLGDLTNYSPYKPTPPLPEIHDSDLVVLAVDAPQWLLFRLIDALKDSKAGAAAVPAPGGAVVLWSCVKDVAQWDFVPVTELNEYPLMSRREPVLTLGSGTESTPPESEKSESEVSVEVRHERKTTKPDVAIHAWIPKDEYFQAHLYDIDAPVNYVVATIATLDQASVDARCKKYSDAAREVKSVRINDFFDIAKIAEELEAELRAERIPVESRVAINFTGASKYLWKALEYVACALFENFYFVSYDLANGRKQVSEDCLKWRWEPIGAPIPSPTSVPAAKATPPRLSDNDTVDVWKLIQSFNGDPNSRMMEISARQDLTRGLWKFRELMTKPYVTVPNGKISFQQAVLLEPKLTKIKAENKEKNLMLYLIRTGNVPSLYEGVGHGSSRKNRTFPLKSWNEGMINDYFSGGWFEEYLLLLLNDMKSAMALRKIKTQINVIVEGHEIDVLAFDGYRYYLFECKTGRNNTPDAVDKLGGIVQNIRKKVSGAEVLGVMFYLQELASNCSIVNKVKTSATVACLSGSRLPELIKSGCILTLTPGEVLH